MQVHIPNKNQYAKFKKIILKYNSAFLKKNLKIFEVFDEETK